MRIRTRVCGKLAHELGAGRDAVDPGHLDVEQCDVGRAAPRRVEHGVSALDLGHDVDVALQGEQARERPADHRLVLGDQDPDHARARGTLSRRRNPPSGRAPASRVPRIPAARSASPVRPLPAIAAP